MIAALFIGAKVGLQKIWEEKQLQYQKYNDQFEEDDGPKPLTHGHMGETLVVKQKDMAKHLLHTDLSSSRSVLKIQNN